jgi:hypothetical protein
MNCQDIEFSEEKSKRRMEGAAEVFDCDVLRRILALALHLLGAKRSDIASLLGSSAESIKTTLRVLLRDGLPALRDRRSSGREAPKYLSGPSPSCSLRKEASCLIVDWGDPNRELRLPTAHKVQARTVLLSLCHAGFLSTRETASALEISVPHCYQLAHALAATDVTEALIDRRRGQRSDYRMGAEQKAELIQEFASQAILKLPTSSTVLTELVNKRTSNDLSDRTVRWHMNKLALPNLRESLAVLVEEKKRRLNLIDP